MMTEQLEPAAWRATHSLTGTLINFIDPRREERIERLREQDRWTVEPLFTASQFQNLLDQRIDELEDTMELVEEKFDLPHGEARLSRTIQELERVRERLQLKEVAE